MKYKTALKQSIVSVKFLSVVTLAMLGLTIRFPNAYTIVPHQLLKEHVSRVEY